MAWPLCLFFLAGLVPVTVMYERGRACEYAAPSQSLRRIILSCVLTRIGIVNNSNLFVYAWTLCLFFVLMFVSHLYPFV